MVEERLHDNEFPWMARLHRPISKDGEETRQTWGRRQSIVSRIVAVWDYRSITVLRDWRREALEAVEMLAAQGLGRSGGWKSESTTAYLHQLSLKKQLYSG